MKDIALIILIVVITLSEALGQFLLSVSHHYTQNNIPYFGFFPTKFLPIITWLLYGVCTYLLLHSYKYTTMGKAEVYWDALSALIVPFIGLIYFSNKINYVGWTGIFLIIIGTLMLSYERKLKNKL